MLLVEPDKVLAKTTLSEFKTQGHEINWARDAQGAIDAIDTKQPDVVVLELQLGLHNGIELLYEIRSYPEWQDLPVVLYTLNNRAIEPHFRTVLRQLGVQAVYYKPDVSPKQLCQKINQLQLT